MALSGVVDITPVFRGYWYGVASMIAYNAVCMMRPISPFYPTSIIYGSFSMSPYKIFTISLIVAYSGYSMIFGRILIGTFVKYHQAWSLFYNSVVVFDVMK